MSEATREPSLPRADAQRDGRVRRVLFVEGLANLAVLVVFVALLVRELPFGAGAELYRDWDHLLVHAEVSADAVMRHGEPPFWNPFPCGGLPLLAKPQSRVLSPFFPLHLALGPTDALRWELALHLLLAATGMVLLARLTHVDKRAASAAGMVGAVVFAGSSFFPLHFAEGHHWILSAAYVPWLFLGFELGRSRPSRAILGGLALALMVGEGGATIAPAIALFLACYAAVTAVHERSPAPLVTAALVFSSGALFAAPKLVPLAHFMAERPRVTFDQFPLGATEILHILVDRDQSPFRAFDWHYWGWHEQGHYVGVAGLVLACVATVFGGLRARILGGLALVFAVLAAGPFHRFAPWVGLHLLPIFDAQHVTSRYLIPVAFAVAALAAQGAAVVAGRIQSVSPAASKAVAALLVLGMAADVVYVNHGTLGVLSEQPCPARPWPQGTQRGDPIVTLRRVPEQMLRCATPEAWTRSAMVPAARVGVALIEAYDALCPRDEHSRVVLVPTGTGRDPIVMRVSRNEGRKRGLTGLGEPGYRGEVYLRQSSGRVAIRDRSFNKQIVRVDAPEGGTIVFNQNWDPGWTTDRGRILRDARDRLNVELEPREVAEPYDVTLRYSPPGFGIGVALASVGVLATVAMLWRDRHKETA